MADGSFEKAFVVAVVVAAHAKTLFESRFCSFSVLLRIKLNWSNNFHEIYAHSLPFLFKLKNLMLFDKLSLILLPI